MCLNGTSQKTKTFFSVNLANLYKSVACSLYIYQKYMFEMNKTFVAGKFFHFDRYTPNPFNVIILNIIKVVSQRSEN